MTLNESIWRLQNRSVYGADDYERPYVVEDNASAVGGIIAGSIIADELLNSGNNYMPEDSAQYDNNQPDDSSFDNNSSFD